MSLRRFAARDNNKLQPCIFNPDNLVTILDNKPDIALACPLKASPEDMVLELIFELMMKTI